MFLGRSMKPFVSVKVRSFGRNTDLGRQEDVAGAVLGVDLLHLRNRLPRVHELFQWRHRADDLLEGCV